MELNGAAPSTLLGKPQHRGLVLRKCVCPAQVLMMVGINPVSDALGRVNKLEVIPLEELGRPRIDVVVNCSGVFRDLFVNQMNLLDRAIKMAAEQDEPEDMNFVRKHARIQVRTQSSLQTSAMHLLTRCVTRIFCGALCSACAWMMHRAGASQSCQQGGASWLRCMLCRPPFYAGQAAHQLAETWSDTKHNARRRRRPG